MSLEHFKKQVLLLHSEQGTLDNLSSGFNDRYTVHCATSGSEALNTLGETQIDVIVSAQDLPGMSGLDALREAKKRSPDTIGILLAGNEDEGLEALVGDQEVFQVVRGSITPDSLKSLIDNATQKARLVTLAESANDTAASPDAPFPENIVMETAENGSTIISDGTGRLPALDPQKVSSITDVGSRAVDVLVLTQDEDFLATVQESAHGLHNVIHANTLTQADEAVSKSKVGVAVVDAAMIGANVEKLAMHLRARSSRLVAIVAGRRDDGEMLMDLINRGKVYRFLMKPVSPGRSRLAIEASVKHHLEAPDSAFKLAAAAAKAASTPQPKPAPPAAKAKAAPQPAKTEAAPTIVPNRDESLSPPDDGFMEAFNANDTSFTETMTRAATSVAKPLSSGKKTAVEPVTKAPAAASSGGTLLSGPKILGIGAALVAIVALGFWLFGGYYNAIVDEEVPELTPTFAEADPVFETETFVPSTSAVDALIEEAQLAVAAGQVFNPPGSNAIELYLSALEVAPDDPAAEAGLEDVIGQALGLAETALLERRAEDVVAALERVALATPDNSRLPFLQAQLAQMQLRSHLDDTRAAIRDSRFEDATRALDAARLLSVPDASEIDSVADELSAALSEQHVDDVLAQAIARLNEDKLIAPSNDNARFYYELALSNDPGNAAARQGLTVIAGKLVLQAREQIVAGNFEIAAALLADVRRLDPTSRELAASTTALFAARDRRDEDARRAAEQRAAVQQAAAERLAVEQLAGEEPGAEQLTAAAAAEEPGAEQLTAEAAAEEQASSEQVAIDEIVADPLVEQEVADSTVASDDQVVETVADSAALVAELEPQDEPVQQAQITPQNEVPVAVSTLTRTRYVAPKYPRSAQRRGQIGWVDVVFTVDIDGKVDDIIVRDSQPDETFTEAAINAVVDWEFEPIIENGVAVRKRAAIRMLFALE